LDVLNQFLTYTDNEHSWPRNKLLNAEDKINISMHKTGSRFYTVYRQVQYSRWCHWYFSLT